MYIMFIPIAAFLITFFLLWRYVTAKRYNSHIRKLAAYQAQQREYGHTVDTTNPTNKTNAQ